ncbi:hypothetical protein ACOME3_003649 [Neoechinorhynchus agilis]
MSSATPFPVKYRCHCGRYYPFSLLYFCCYCGELRCRDCNQIEIDSRYCPNCLEKFFSQEAAAKQNRCTSCYECPLCGSHLIPKAMKAPTSATNENPESPPSYVYFYSCGYCHWTTQEADLDLKPSLNVGWTEWASEIRSSDKIERLSKSYKQQALLDRVNRNKSRIGRRKSALASLTSNSDEYPGMMGTLIRRGLIAPSIMNEIETEPIVMVLQDSSDDSDIFNHNSVTDSLRTITDPSMIPCLDRRFKVPGCLNESKPLGPIRVGMLTRLSRRCRKCAHLLVKREPNTLVNEFKFERTAVHNIPELRVWYWVESSDRKAINHQMGVDVVVVLVNRSECAMQARFIKPNDIPNEGVNANVVEYPIGNFWLLSHGDVASAFAAHGAIDPASHDEYQKPWFVHRSKCKLAVKLRVDPYDSEYKSLCFPISIEHQCSLMEASSCTSPINVLPKPICQWIKQTIVVNIPKKSPVAPSFLVPSSLVKRVLADGIKSDYNNQC